MSEHTQNGKVGRLDLLAERAAKGEPLFQDGTPAVPTAASTRPDHQPAQPTRTRESKCLDDIRAALQDAGRRLTTTQLLAALDRRGTPWGESTVKHTLAAAVDAGFLTNDQRANPRGYGLAEGQPAEAGTVPPPPSPVAVLAGRFVGEMVRLDLRPLHFSLVCNGVSVTVDVRAEGETVSAGPPDLLPVERRVLAVLTTEYQDAKVIARLAGRSRNYVRAALHSLCEKRLAEYFPRKGYRRKGRPESEDSHA